MSTRELACVGCGAPVGTATVRSTEGRRARTATGRERMLDALARGAVCERCSGRDRAARKDARRLELLSGGLTQEQRARTVACPLKRCAAKIGQDCRPVDGALVMGPGGTLGWVHAARLEAAYAALKAAAHAAGAKYNAEHDRGRRLVHLAEAIALASNAAAAQPRVDVDERGLLVVRYPRRAAEPAAAGPLAQLGLFDEPEP